MSIPTTGEEYSKLMENLRYAEEHAAMIAHLHNANDKREAATQWLRVSEQFRKLQHTLTQLAMGRLQ
jgi:hypothetical protein